MLGAILKATNSSFQKGMTIYPSIYVKKVMKLLAFIFEQPPYLNVVFSDIVIFQGIRTSIAKKAYIYVIFFSRWVRTTLPSGSAHAMKGLFDTHMV